MQTSPPYHIEIDPDTRRAIDMIMVLLTPDQLRLLRWNGSVGNWTFLDRMLFTFRDSVPAFPLHRIRLIAGQIIGAHAHRLKLGYSLNSNTGLIDSLRALFRLKNPALITFEVSSD